MNRMERNRLNELTREVDGLLDMGPKYLPNIKNIDVLEALLADVKDIANGQRPTHVHKMVLDEVERLQAELERLS